MQRRTVKITTIIVLLSFLTAFLQFGTFYLLDSYIAAFTLSALTILIITHILLELSIGYHACFLYSFLLIIYTSAICCFLYILPSSTLAAFPAPNLQNTLLVPHSSYYIAVILNWFIPVLYCIIRNIMDRGPRFMNFRKFFIRSSTIFAVYYTGSFIYQIFIHHCVLPKAETLSVSTRLIPFMTISSYVESAIYDSVSLAPLLTVVGIYLLLYLPFGFYCRLLLKEKTFLLRFALFVLFPAAAELIRYLTGDLVFVTDHVILGILGCLIGSGLYHILNSIYRNVKEEDFLYEHSPFISFLDKYK